MHYACNTDSDIGAGSAAIVYGATVAADGQLVNIAADTLWDLLKGLWTSTASAGALRLELKLDIGWGLVGAATPSAPAGTGSASLLNSVATLSMKASDNTYVKFSLPESNLPVPETHVIGGGANGAVDAFCASLRATPGTGELADIICSRSKHRIIGQQRWFTTYSRRIRKQRGLL
jgi:hypothetical protein